jgi:hypothetical protein
MLFLRGLQGRTRSVARMPHLLRVQRWLANNINVRRWAEIVDIGLNLSRLGNGIDIPN